MRPLPYFSRSQLSVILLLGAALLGLYAWRAHLVSPPAPPPPGALTLTFVEVTGQVPHSGVYSFPKPPTLKEVWAKAGAPGPPPDPEKIIASGTLVEVTPDGGSRLSSISGARLVTMGLPIDLNRATTQDLDAIPGLGPALAKRIVDYRTAHGPFNKIEDLLKVSGIGPQNLEKLKPYLGLGASEARAPSDWQAAMATGPAGPGTEIRVREGGLPGSQSGLPPKASGRIINPNLASREDLETLPGIGPVLAQRIIAHRQAHGPYKKIADLRKVSGIGPKKLEKIKPYLSMDN